MSLLPRLSPLASRRFGARPPSRSVEAELAQVVEARRSALGLPSSEAYFAWLAAAPEEELPHFASAFTNGWTWFFRDQAPLEVLADELRARALGRPANVWVAGCSTGEEAYSVAIAFAERGVPVHVLGTDLDGARVAWARRGVYGSLAVRRVPSDVIRRYFAVRGDDTLRIDRELAKHVEFREHNLMDAPPWSPTYGGWDAILCRNVLLHCTDEAADQIVERLRAALSPEGRLLLGPGDRRPRELPKARPIRASAPPRTTISGAWPLHEVKEPPPVESCAQAMPSRAVESSPRAPSRLDDPWPPIVAMLQRRDREGATRALEALLATTPTHVPAWLALGSLRLANDEVAALEAYARAERLEPTSAEVHYLVGAARRRRGEWETAVTALRRAVFLDEDLWPARYLLAGCWERLGARERAHRAYVETLRSLERRPVIRWRSCVDEIDEFACSSSLVRAVCGERSAAPDENGGVRWR